MEILNNIQREVLGLFAEVSVDSQYFYLTGGTALSYFYLKHRKSNDLDFFSTTEEIILPFSYGLEEAFKSKKMLVQRQRGMHSFVELLLEKDNDKTIIHLACDTPFRLGSLREFPEYPKLKVDNLIDISANKLLALFGRAQLRDFIDIYFLVKKGKFMPEDLIKNAKIKDPGFDLYWLGVALNRIDSFEKDCFEDFLLSESVNQQDLVSFFNQWQKNISQEVCGGKKND